MTAVWAEYRVYELEIESPAPQTQPANQIANQIKVRRIFSSLDDRQYPGYYPLAKGESIRYLDSWMCYQSGAGFKPYCPKPRPVVKTQPQSNSASSSQANGSRSTK